MKLLEDNYFRFVLFAAVATRVLIFLAALLGPALLVEGPAYNRISSNLFLNSFAQYDASAYLDIAQNGYNNQFMERGNYQWWPLLPLVIRFASLVFDPVLAGFLICNLALFGALIYLYLILKKDFGEKIASTSLALMMLFPTSYFYSSIYSESLFLFTTAASLYYAKQSRWGLASVFGALSALSRIFGAFIVIPLGYLYLKERRWTWYALKWERLDRKLLWFLLIPLAVLLFSAHLYALTGNPLKFTDHSQTSERRFALPFALVIHEVEMWLDASWFYRGYHTFNLVVYLSFVVAALFAFKRLPWDYSLYLGYSMLIPTVSTPIQGFTRYCLVMFPAFILVAQAQEKGWVRRLTYVGVGVSVLLLVFFTLWHTRGGFSIA